MPFHTQQKTVIALGFFDGVHRGHGELIKMAVRRAGEQDATPAVLSFDVSPASVITGRPVPLIGSVETRAYIVKRFFGVEDFILLHFDRAMMEMNWKLFLDSLIETHNACHLVIGHDFHCGYKGEGNPECISAYCAEKGIGCDVIPKFSMDGITVSSTYIRELISEGKVEEANLFLGHPYLYAGTVTGGRRVGRKMGTPTINLVGDDENLVLPGRGVYASLVTVGDRLLPSITNIGVRPTFGTGGAPSVETFIFDFEGDLYGSRILLELHKFLRPELCFESPKALSAQIAADIEAVKQYFAQ